MQTSMIAILIALCVPPMICAENIPGLNVSYDTKNDRLTVDAKSVPLTQILAQISEQSGVEILVDPSVEKDINIYLPAQPLEKALKQLARDLNYAMHYDKAESRLVAMKIVPQGKQTSSNFVSVTKPTARGGRPYGSGDDNIDVGSGGGYRSRSNLIVGDYLDSRSKSNSSAANQEITLSPEEMEAQGNSVTPRKRKIRQHHPQHNNLLNESLSETANGGDSSDDSASDQ
ncbi:MAG: hypothetical protein ACYTBV_18645 [Planctomycetota bacterium]|jgi:hypothetical protein